MFTTKPHPSALIGLDGASVWLNSEPLSAAGLRGRVTLVDFWTYSCVNWLRTLPYVRAWHERYRERGLVVVGAPAPEFGFEHDLDNVRRAIGELDVGYPIVIDNDFAIWRSFGNHYWPAVYLVDGDGRVRFHHFGEEAYAETERAIQALLGTDEELVRVDAGGRFEAADWSVVGSPETYVGDARGERRRDRPPDELALNEWALSGDWSVGDESAELGTAGGSSPTASRRATSTSCSRRRPRAPRCASPSGSTAGRPATPTASTPTSPARAPSTSRGCTSSSASRKRSASVASRSRSTARACGRTSSPSADYGTQVSSAGVTCSSCVIARGLWLAR